MLISVTQLSACVGEWEQADLHYVDHLLNADVLRACNPYIQSNGQLKRRHDDCDGWRDGVCAFTSCAPLILYCARTKGKK